MLLPLQFGAKHKDRKLKLPHDYKYDDAKPKQVVGPGKIFSLTDNEEGEPGLVQQYAKWMTSPGKPAVYAGNCKSYVEKDFWHRIGRTDQRLER